MNCNLLMATTMQGKNLIHNVQTTGTIIIKVNRILYILIKIITKITLSYLLGNFRYLCKEYIRAIVNRLYIKIMN